MILQRSTKNTILVLTMVCVLLILWLRMHKCLYESFVPKTAANLALEVGDYRSDIGFAPAANDIDVRGSLRDDSGWSWSG